MENDKNGTYTGTVAMAPPVSAGIAMQANAHSVGLMFEQSVVQQQNQFQLGISSSIMNVKKIARVKIKRKGLRKSRFDI